MIMALGGGNFNSYNKTLPGVYINTISNGSEVAETERGIVAVPLSLSWGPEAEIVSVDVVELGTKCKELFGFALTTDEMKPLRELASGADKILVYRLNAGGAKATLSQSEKVIAQAKHPGTRGNNIAIEVFDDIDSGRYVVRTLLDAVPVDEQIVQNAADLKNNKFVDFQNTDSWTLAALAATTLDGGTDGTATNESYIAMEELLQSYSFNVLCLPTADDATKGVIATFTKRVRESRGQNFQVVMYDYAEADHEAIISVKNKALEDGEEYGLVYWVAGQAAGAAVGTSLTGNTYNGEYTPEVKFTQAELENALKNGDFVFHRVNDAVRVLRDVNTLKTISAEKGADFKNNDIIRTLDAISNDITATFADYVYGAVKNNDEGRDLLRDDISDILARYTTTGAIEPVEVTNIKVEAVSKTAVYISVPVTVVGTIDTVYIQITVI